MITCAKALWFTNVLPQLGAGSFPAPFGPQIIYDHFEKRWVILYVATDLATAAYYLISASDDGDPLGTWYHFAVPAHFNGSTPSAGFGDYPKMGVDQHAIYVTANQYGFTSGFLGAKLYIFSKPQFYNNTAGAITWTDFWKLRDPDNFEVGVFTVVPAPTFGAPGAEFLINDSPCIDGTFMTLWSLSNPWSGAPTLTAVNVPVVTSFGLPSIARQLGGDGEPAIDVGTRGLRAGALPAHQYLDGHCRRGCSVRRG
jgi:hypothetical protein